VVLCNITDEPAAYPYAVDAPAHGLPASGAYRLEHSAPAGRSYIGEQPAGVVRRTENLAPREIRVLEIAAI
jgi:hypothetical protein